MLGSKGLKVEKVKDLARIHRHCRGLVVHRSALGELIKVWISETSMMNFERTCDVGSSSEVRVHMPIALSNHRLDDDGDAISYYTGSMSSIESIAYSLGSS